MENQDPLNPTDSSEYAQQLATFSGVEEAVLTNDLLTALMVQMNTTGMAQLADWVGKEARAAAPAYFDGSPITLAPNPAVIADKVELVVYDEDGNEVLNKDGATKEYQLNYKATKGLDWFIEGLEQTDLQEQDNE